MKSLKTMIWPVHSGCWNSMFRNARSWQSTNVIHRPTGTSYHLPAGGSNHQLQMVSEEKDLGSVIDSVHSGPASVGISQLTLPASDLWVLRDGPDHSCSLDAASCKLLCMSSLNGTCNLMVLELSISSDDCMYAVPTFSSYSSTSTSVASAIMTHIFHFPSFY